MPRQWSRRVADHRARPFELVEIQLRHEHWILPRQASCVGDGRRQLTGDADARASPGPFGHEYRGGLSGHQRWIAQHIRANDDAERAAQMFGDAADVEEVDLARAA